MKKNVKGFTLIELLVVIAIIGLLATLAIVSLRNAQQRARDTKRVTDAKSIQTAVELYASENSNAYPIATSWNTAGDATSLEALLDLYITNLPVDPSNADGFRYVYASNGTNEYVVATTLEGSDQPGLLQDSDTSEGGTGFEYVVSDGSTEPADDAVFDCADDVYCLVE